MANWIGGPINSVLTVETVLMGIEWLVERFMELAVSLWELGRRRNLFFRANPKFKVNLEPFHKLTF